MRVVSSRRWFSLGVGFLCLLSGLLVLAYSQVSAVLPDTANPDFDGLREGSVLGEGGGVFISAVLATTGAIVLLNATSRAPQPSKALALTVFGATFPLFLFIQTLLVIYGVASGEDASRWLYFSASYFFHIGGALSFAAVYILFLFTLLLVYLLLGSTAYLLAPKRFVPALFDRSNWQKNEAVHVAASLFLLMSLTVLVVYVFWLAGETDPARLRGEGMLADLLLPLYYLMGILLFALILTVAAHAFLLNWGTQAPGDLGTLVQSVRNISRVERALLIAAAALNAIILLGPDLPSALDLSTSFAFDVSPRGLSYAFYLLLTPYIPYVITTRRLEYLLRQGRAPTTASIFQERSLRLVVVHLSGLILLTALGVAARWDPMWLMLTFAAWTGGVLLTAALRVKAGIGLPKVLFRDDAGPALFFVFLGIALTSGLMLWGAGNTFEVRYLPGQDTLEVVNESGYGLDIFARVAAVAVIIGSLVLTLDLWLTSYGVERRLVGHYLGIFVSSTLAALLVFSVGVWTSGSAGLRDAYAGFAFRQYYALEEFGVGLLLTGTFVYVFFALRAIMRPILEREGTARAQRAVAVKWR